jgi:hypothetical protein
VILRERTHDLHLFLCHIFAYSVWFLLQNPQDIFQNFLVTQSHALYNICRRPTTELVLVFYHKLLDVKVRYNFNENKLKHIFCAYQMFSPQQRPKRFHYSLYLNDKMCVHIKDQIFKRLLIDS